MWNQNMAAPKPDFVELFSFMLVCHKTSDLPDIQAYYAANPPGFTEAEKERWKLKRQMVVEEMESRKPKSKKK